MEICTVDSEEAVEVNEDEDDGEYVGLGPRALLGLPTAGLD